MFYWIIFIVVMAIVITLTTLGLKKNVKKTGDIIGREEEEDVVEGERRKRQRQRSGGGCGCGGRRH